MEVKDAIERRRSVRKYIDKEVSEDIILEAIRYGTMAPSAHNRQPWKFKILSKEEKDKIADLLYDKTKNIPSHTGPNTANIIKEVSSLVIIYYDKVNSEEYDRDMDIISIGACIENMILYLTSLDIGTLWIGNTNIINKEIKEYLGIDMETVSTLGIGYMEYNPNMRPRKEFNDVFVN